jgi:hypothetical protein|tara:strand:+ start:1321 stop:1584 length:264 start_codon:yes stop_codon:yes gene_type:complete
MMPNPESPFVAIVEWICANKDTVILLPEMNLGYQESIASIICNQGGTAAYFEDGSERLLLVGTVHLGRNLIEVQNQAKELSGREVEP